MILNFQLVHYFQILTVDDFLGDPRIFKKSLLKYL